MLSTKKNNDFPKISIIVPMYNAEKYMEKTLQTISQQTYTNFEVLMIDDCSTDNTKKIAKSYLKDNRFTLIALKTNSGVANARNIGIENANGDYICFLDSDDWWSPFKLEIQINYMIRKNLTLSCMSYTRINEKGEAISEVFPPKIIKYNDLLKSNHIGNLTSMIKKQVIGSSRFEKIGHEDYIFWLEILKKNIDCYTVVAPPIHNFYLVRKSSLSSNKIKTIKWQWRIYRKNENLNLFKSLFFLIHYIFYGLKKRF